MSDAVPLPPRPNLEQYKKIAKDLQAACKSGEAASIGDWAARWRKFQETHPRAGRCLLADAQFFLARAHGFASWPKFAAHVEALKRARSPVSQFEAAVDAIVAGDAAGLERLLRENPELARARSTREHRSTLLHYVSANGVEDFRQKTPPNIVEIARLLLGAGADVNAESDAYGGRSTALGLTATSCHPETAGVQTALMELLIGHRAAIDGPDAPSAVNNCLGNGRGLAAVFLASRGARLDLEGAAGVGRLDLVRSCFSDDGSLKPPATRKQMEDGFAWACEFGRTDVVEFLLQRGMTVDVKLRHYGQTGLHWAAFGGHADTVRLLIARGSPLEWKDETFDGTPLAWALHEWRHAGAGVSGGGSYYEVVALLVRAGATPEDADTEAARHDPRMLAALRGESPKD
jgi:hypothetical protein